MNNHCYEELDDFEIENLYEINTIFYITLQIIEYLRIIKTFFLNLMSLFLINNYIMGLGSRV